MGSCASHHHMAIDEYAHTRKIRWIPDQMDHSVTIRSSNSIADEEDTSTPESPKLIDSSLLKSN